MATQVKTGIYEVNDIANVLSPSLLVFPDLVGKNLDHMVEIAGSAARLRPHCKTHKMSKVIEMLLERGVTKHKCATVAEAEMLAETGATDICLAYNLVGPNIGRAVAFLDRYPNVKLSVTADHAVPLKLLGEAMHAAGHTVDVLLDLDTGLARTGISSGEEAKELYRSFATTPGVAPGGIQLYDGQHHQTDRNERKEAVLGSWKIASQFRDELVAEGLPVPAIVAGGSGTFPLYAEIDDPALELSPGTIIFFDEGYTKRYPDLDFTPAAALLTRVMSRPTPNRMTLDLGNKAVASDPPFESRLLFPELPEAKVVNHSEEHLVLETDLAARYQPGDALLAIPIHICPTSALHRSAYVVRDGQVVESWDVTARDRSLTL